MVLTRATNQPGPDGVLGTAGDIREHNNETTPWIDLNQVYTSHESHQVFLREYVLVDGKPQATGRMLDGEHGGPPTWADIKQQARTMLGIELSDFDVGRVPLVATDLYGKFIPGANGFAQLVTATGLVEGNPDQPVAASSAFAVGRAFLNDIAHSAAPGMVDHDRNPATAMIATQADADTDAGNPIALNAFGVATTYDNELLDKHFIVGDGRGNENIGLTAVHHVFHGEHNLRVDQIKSELLSSGDVAFLNEWLLVDVAVMPADTASLVWDGERLFQAARFSTEMVYQHLVFEEFARTVAPNVDPFVFSNSVDISGDIVAEFAHVVYRFGHSMLNETVDRLSADGQAFDNIGLIEAFLNPVEYVASGIDSDAASGAILRGMSRQVGNEIDEFLTEALRNNLVGLPLDLGALNIARGRDTGVPSLNEARAQFFAQTSDTRLDPYDSWADFALNMQNPASIINFIAAYGMHGSITSATTLEGKRDAAILLVLGGNGAPADRVDFLNSTGAWATVESGLNNVDFWIGGLAEKKMTFGGLLGSTFEFIFEYQMESLQNGDRFYYLSRAQGMNLLNQLEADSFAELVMRNTDLGNPGATHLYSSMFLTPDHTLELDRARQTLPDPIRNDALLQAINPLIIRADTNGDGIDDFLRYNGDGHVVLSGTEQNDTLIGGAGDDSLWGDGGDDRLDGGLGVDHIFGGAGDDIITDSGNDIGVGDVIHGDDGNDVINGGVGNDLIFGGAGQDFIFGGRDNKDITAGEGNDFVRGPDGLSFIKGNEGDDWLEGGASFDTLAGDNSELFFNSPIIGHDVLNGRGNDNDYDAESGDDIMFQGPGIQRNNGMAGFDWIIHKGNTQAADSDLGIPIFANQQANILRDRSDLVEGLSGWDLDDRLIGREVVIGAYDAVSAAAAQFDPASPFQSYSNALTEEGVARIAGLDALVAHLPRATFTIAGKQETVVVFDDTLVQRDAAGNVLTMFDGASDILLGGGGSDYIEGKAGNDIIDGDRWLNVRIRISDAAGNEIGSADTLDGQVISPAGVVLFGGRTLDAMMFDRTLNPGQLSIVRELLDGDVNDLAIDVAGYAGNFADYVVSRNADGSITIGNTVTAPPSSLTGTDRLFNMEKARFADHELWLVNKAATGQVTASFTPEAAALRVTANAVNTKDLNNVSPTNPDGAVTGGITMAIETGTVNGTNVTWTAAGASLAQGTTAGRLVRGTAEFTDALGNAEKINGQVYNLVVGTTGDDTLAGDSNAAATNVDVLYGMAGNDVIRAGVGNDILFGGDGNDQLFGEAGDDSMFGGLGNDDYYVTDAGDTATEAANEGTDRVFSTISYTLGDNLEQLHLQGTAAIDGTGNNLDNLIVGNSAANTLRGGAGNDTLQGGAGDDILYGDAGNDAMAGGLGNDDFYVTDAGDTVIEAANEGTDRVFSTVTHTLATNVEELHLLGAAALNGTGNTLNNRIVGNSAANTLRGGAGNDILEGGAGDDILYGEAGNDTMMGGLGNDQFYVTETGDMVIEAADEGIDRVYSTITHTLSNNVEELFLQGTAVINGTGNALDNRIVGNASANTLSGGDGNDILSGGGGNDILLGGAGNDVLYGEAGSDTMTGGLGNDDYYVTDTGDIVNENANEGIDRVFSTISYTLGANVEELHLQGTSGLNGTGNALNNRIVGNSAANTLSGGDGNDILEGGAGNDTLQDGNDRLIGGAGFDRLTGGAGADMFVFGDGDIGSALFVSETVTDFSFAQGDRFDFSLMDANTTTAGDDAFTFIGTRGFSGTVGELRYTPGLLGGATIQGDINGDGAADFALLVQNISTLNEAMFIL